MKEDHFHVEPARDTPGWFTWDLDDNSRFSGHAMGPLLVRHETGDNGKPAARLRMQPEHRHSNVLDSVHGGVLLALIDISLFAAIRLLINGDASGSVTLDLSTQFIGAGHLGRPLDAVTEVLRETGRLVFLRGLVEQDDQTVAAFSATIRKPSR